MNPASIAGHVIELLTLTDRGSAPADRVAAGFFRDRRYLGSRDRRAISDTLFGIIRHRRYLEALLEEFLRRNPSYASIDAAPGRYIPLLLIHACVHPGRDRDVQEPPGPGTAEPDAYAATPADLNLIWSPHFPDLDPAPLIAWAVAEKDLGFLSETPAVTLGVRHSFQDWMVAEWLNRWPGEIGELLEALNTPGAVAIRVNRLKTDRAACLGRIVEEGIAASEVPFPETALVLSKRFNQNASAAFKEGWFEIQDLGSQAISLVCAPKSGQLVIDGCAGAGGKTLHLADLMGNSGEILAVDTDQARLKELSLRARRAGVTIAKAVLRRDFDLPKYEGRADLVLVDAPCTGSGTIRRNPSLKWTIKEEEVARYAVRQLELLRGYAPLVRPGGRMVYSTCSLFRAENEDVVKKFLKGNAAFRSVAVSDVIRWPVDPGAGKGVTLLPHRNQTDGFFISALERAR